MSTSKRLQFVRVIGRGAVGSVYLALLVDERGPRSVAVKVLVGDGPQQAFFLSRIRDEARLLALLRDDSVLKVLDLVKFEGRDAVVMEYIEGADLETMGAADPPSTKALTLLGAQVAGALHRAHVATHPKTKSPLGVVHRDVKPANIMVTISGRAKLLDFGVARARFDARESFTGQLVLGTLNYMAPEYIVTGQVSPKVDVYGLGLSLWEAATTTPYGQPKVRRDSHDERLDERMRELGSEHAVLVPIVRQMLAWDPLMRPTGAQIEHELLAVAESLPGPGLAAWAKEHVPSILARRPPLEDVAGLVGRAVDIDAETILSSDPSVDSPSDTHVPESWPLSDEPTVERAPSAPRPEKSLFRYAVQGIVLGSTVGILVVLFVVGLLLLRGAVPS